MEGRQCVSNKHNSRLFNSIKCSSDGQFSFIINLNQFRSRKSPENLCAKKLILFSSDIKDITAAELNDARFANKFRELIIILSDREFKLKMLFI